MSRIESGAAKVDITPLIAEIGMMGWGVFGNTVEGIHTHLFARSVALIDRETGKRIVIVCSDICFVSQSIRLGVMEKLSREHPELKLKDEEVMLTATHTHSAPGGYSHYVLYNITVPGYCAEVLDVFVKGITDSIVHAFQNLKPAEIRIEKGKFPLNVPVAFNRALKSWNANSDTQKYHTADRHRAIDREMTLIRIDRDDGIPLASINFFGVHSTSVHGDNHKISSDNKGYAAQMFEDRMGDGFVALFAQGTTGDVTPNYRRFMGLRMVMGRFRNDFRSARYNGLLQFRQARNLFLRAKERPALNDESDFKIDSIFSYFDFSNVEVDSEFAQGQTEATTGPATLGTPFLLGTDEGPGAPAFLVAFVNFLEKYRRILFYVLGRVFRKPVEPLYKDHPIHGTKTAFIETGKSRVLGASRLEKLVLPSWLHPAIREIKMLGLKNATGKPFTPPILPLQIVQIGPLAILAVPSEFTTNSGNRMKKLLKTSLKQKGVQHAVVCGYSNSYSGYVTTFEEYQLQYYEGGSTHFGKWTLAAYQTLVKRMAQMFLKPNSERKPLSNEQPLQFTPEELALRAFEPKRKTYLSPKVVSHPK